MTTLVSPQGTLDATVVVIVGETLGKEATGTLAPPENAHSDRMSANPCPTMLATYTVHLWDPMQGM